MLKKRLKTILLLLPLTIIVVLYADSRLFALILGLLIAGGAYEWTQLIPINKQVLRLTTILLMLGLMLLVYLYPLGIHYLLLSSTLCWVYMATAIMAYPRGQRFWACQSVVMVLLLVCLISSFAALLHLENHQQGRALVMYLLFVIWGADVGAYVAGKRYGKNKLIPKVSPGKTVEGLLGALVTVSVFSVLGQCYFTPSSLLLWYALSLITLVAAVIGDLLISMLKRRVSLKDTGNIFPGHGGILDRIDSLLAASVVFVFFAQWWQLI